MRATQRGDEVETAWKWKMTEAETTQMDKDNEETRKGEEKPRMTRVEQTKLRGR